MKISALQKYVVRALVIGRPAGKSDTTAKDAPLADHTPGRWECYLSETAIGNNLVYQLYGAVVRQISDSGFQGPAPFASVRLVNPIARLVNPIGCSIAPLGEAVRLESLPFVVEEDPSKDWWKRVEVAYYPILGEKVSKELRAAKSPSDLAQLQERNAKPREFFQALLGKREAA